ncbi:MAG: S8 family peptidase, partial [Bacteroidaceae bacterium]|nr:S8 family peptidase [Bacteroidaceae bacterium]
YDDRSTEGGGDNREPGFVLHGDALQAHAQGLASDLQEVRLQLREALAQKRTLPVIVATCLNESAIAKTHRKRVVNILESDGNDNVVGVYGDRQILSVLPNEAVLDNLENSIYKEESATLTSSLTGIEVFHPIVDEYKDGTVDYRVRLFDYNDFDRNSLARILFEKYCEEIGVQIQKRIRFTADMYIYRVSIDAPDKYLRFVEFEGLYSVEITSPLFVTLDSLADDVIVPVRYPEDGEEYPVVGVLDTGIAPIGHLSPWLLENEHTNYPEEYTNRLHGTAVASIIEYSDDLNGTDICSTDGVNLFSALVYPNQSIYPEDLVDNIREAVERNPDIKIWNMSLGEEEQSELDSYSEFGMALDNIQDENNVLIIKSAGNCHNFEKGLPKQRISKSADSIRALTVGSIAESKAEYDYADPNMPSPFTRVGPGPASIIKPDLVFYGGNAGMHDGKRIEHGIRTFNLDDEDTRCAGTSFSTPAVTRIVSDLAYMMQEEFDPLLLRALTIHYAKYPEGIQMKM